MSKIKTLTLALLCTLSLSSTAFAEGFAMTEWSARGLGLAGGLVARADDASALAYNAAGITQLPGVHFMAGISLVAPYGSIENSVTGQSVSATPNMWTPAHGYLTYQLNDNVWLGLGLYSRFGLGNAYDDNWFGRHNVYGVGVTTVSAVPTLAYKFNDIFSASIGVELMYMSMFLNQRTPEANIPTPLGLYTLPENSAQLQGSSMGVGVHLGLHAKFNEQWSAGLTYKSQVVQNVVGNVQFGNQINFANMYDTGINGTLILPDSISFAIAYKPLDNLSFEVGTVFTRWSSYKDLNIYFDNGFGSSLNKKNWNDGWNFNVSVEYSPLDWLTLRAGYWHETDVSSDTYADYIMPVNGRDTLSLGVGFKYEDWTLDLAYTHIWINDSSYSGNPDVHGTFRGKSFNMGADLYTISVGYTF